MAKGPRDLVQLAKQVFDIAIGEAEYMPKPESVGLTKRHSRRRIIFWRDDYCGIIP
jgi:hypothetical protein